MQKLNRYNPVPRIQFKVEKILKLFLINRMNMSQISRELKISDHTVKRVLDSRNIDTYMNSPISSGMSLLEKLFCIYEDRNIV